MVVRNSGIRIKIYIMFISLKHVLWVYFLAAKLMDCNQLNPKSYLSELSNKSEWKVQNSSLQVCYSTIAVNTKCKINKWWIKPLA